MFVKCVNNIFLLPEKKFAKANFVPGGTSPHTCLTIAPGEGSQKLQIQHHRDLEGI